MFTYNDFVFLHSYGTPVINKYRYVERYELFGQDDRTIENQINPQVPQQTLMTEKYVKLFSVDTWREEAEQ